MKIDNDVLEVLSRAETNGNELLLNGQLDRKMYVKVNKVLEAAGGKWNRKAQAHLFEQDAAERVDQILLTGEVEIPKDEFNFFPTPHDVVERLLELADIQDGMHVLEPSAGQGAIALACAAKGALVECCELMPANVTVLKAFPSLLRVKQGDFLQEQPFASCDRVVMNPPFAKQQDIKHVLHALKFLKPDGLLVSVMSASVTFRSNKLTQAFRDLIDERGGEIIDLPEGSFKSSGTMVNTVIVVIPA